MQLVLILQAPQFSSFLPPPTVRLADINIAANTCGFVLVATQDWLQFYMTEQRVHRSQLYWALLANTKTISEVVLDMIRDYVIPDHNWALEVMVLKERKEREEMRKEHVLNLRYSFYHETD